MMQRKVDRVRSRLGFENCFVVDCKGKSGGLILLWRDSIQVDIYNYSRHHINAMIRCSKDAHQWKFTGFYGHPEAAKRKESWALLRYLASLSPEPWLCIGDFNEILSTSEKTSTSIWPAAQMQLFQKSLSDSKLLDLGYSGPKYTWCNGKQGGDYTRERLDRAVANAEWSSIFNVVEVSVLACSSSDHNPLQVRFSNSNDLKWSKSKIFRYEDSWAKHIEHGGMIKQVWRSKSPRANPCQTIQGNLQGCRRILKKWVRKQKNPVEQRIQTKNQELLQIQMLDDCDNGAEEKVIQEELHNLLAQEELKWKQRAKEAWLQLGDRNTKYFHSCATQKKGRSQVLKIKDIAGRWCHTKEDIEAAFNQYFTELFTTGEDLELETCLDNLDRKSNSRNE